MHGLTMTTSYRMHYYNQDHQYSLPLSYYVHNNIYRHDTFLYVCSINSNTHMVGDLFLSPLHAIVITKPLPSWVLLTPLTLPVWLVLLQEIAEFTHQLLILDLLLYPFLHRVASHLRQHQQHIQPCPCCRCFFH